MSLSEQRGTSAAERRREIAAYVAAMVADLRQLSRKNDLPTLAYLLDMARLEAETESRDGADRDTASAPVLERS